MDSPSPYATPLISPAISLTSFESCVSSCGDFQADMDSGSREYGNEALDTCQEQSSVESTDENSLKNIEIQSLENRVHSDGTMNTTDTTSQTLISSIETDPLIWLPPEPEDIEDDIECSVANNDDDDEYCDGTKWGRPSSLSSFDEECGISNSYKEERRKAMMEAMNGQFKFLVSRFLASEGISFSNGESGESWLDIIASLSWEAALLVKPDDTEGGGMDPGSYVKVKCIACGSRSQSQVIKGLVFKKNTAHKHMPTKCKNPRLLLLRGVLGQGAIGLSSFDSMEQEKDYLKSFIEMIETCHPNVVLVEKNVFRDVQESLLSKGITLVFDMKFSRLERIARCTGSPIISTADILMNLKLKQCDSFHIEKFVEEHNSCEGGKRPSKTLMFFEGCPKPLGCTILLKGAHSDELKRVKRVVHYTVFAAYHLILETSFFADQRAISPNIYTAQGSAFFSNKQLPVTNCNTAPNSVVSTAEVSLSGVAPPCALDIPFSDGSEEKSSYRGRGSNSNSDLDIEGISGTSVNPGYNIDVHSHGNGLMLGGLSDQKCSGGEILQQENSQDSSVCTLHTGQLLSSFSSSLGKVLGDSLPLDSSSSYESILSYFGFKEKEQDCQNIDVEIETKDKLDQGKSHHGICDNEKVEDNFNFSESLEHYGTDIDNKAQMRQKDDIENVLDPQTILVLLSSQRISKGPVCEESRLSRIKYYGNSDFSLGRFLKDILLNQKHSCSACSEPPEAHLYCYTHQNGKLTVLVRRLPLDSHLSGEAEGKIWMWTRCLKCQHESGIPKSSRRVVLSTAAHSLSFGKFLELSFSSHSAAKRLSRCGHLLHRDCLRFFGLGSAIAIFIYSSVEIYAACKPPPVLDFSSLNGQDWLKKEARDVLKKRDQLFSEIANLLQKIYPRFSGRPVNYPGSVKDFSKVEEMLTREKSEFEASLLKTMNNNGQLGKTTSEVLGLPCLFQELLLELYIWDRRFHSLLSSVRYQDAADDATQEKLFPMNQNDMPCNANGEEDTIQVSVNNDSSTQVVPISIEDSSSPGDYLVRNISETKQENNLAVSSGDSNIGVCNLSDSEITESPEVGNLIEQIAAGTSADGGIASALDVGLCSAPSSSPPNYKDCLEDSLPISDSMQVDSEVSLTPENLGHVNSVTPLDVQIAETGSSGEVFGKSMLTDQPPRNYVSSPVSRLGGPENWIWNPFSEIRKAFRKDFLGGYPQKFEFIRSYTPAYLSPKHQLIAQERDWLHFSVGAEGNVMSVCEDEISSIIAYALALSQEKYDSSETTVEKELGKDKGESDKAIENMYSLASDGSVASSLWSSSGSFDLEGIRPSQSFTSASSDELSTSGSEGSLFLDRMLSSENLHPEIHVGVGKAAGKGKFSVVCIHAKQFHALRKSCCPSELAYILSISRCKMWDAQGGKSKAFFAKSLDDRFIIKQIKKTELDSFLKFAPYYFKHISHALSTGSQTCLAKILGIYQVRQTKNGKELKTDLMVMENLLYGRNISRIYDLKGAVYSRYVPDSNNPGAVLLDQNFVEHMGTSPIYVGGKAKHLLQRAIWNDTSFLTSINVMDYSLLVGVDKQRLELVFGIIDYLRQYTWDKQLETWVKASLVVPKNALPTVVSPKEYKKRFRKFMSKYFLTVPGRRERCSETCKFCNDGGSNSSQLHGG